MDHAMPMVDMDHSTMIEVDHTQMSEMEHNEWLDVNSMPEIDHSAMVEVDHTQMSDMDHNTWLAENSMPEMDHEAMPEMDHNQMAEMDHSKMEEHESMDMEHSEEEMEHSGEEMDHSEEEMDHGNMQRASHANETMDHSDMQDMDHSNMEGMDHSKMTEMDHGAHASPVTAGDLGNSMMGQWTTYELPKDQDASYWLKGKYGSHMDLDGTMHLDFVTQLHASTSVRLQDQWYYSTWFQTIDETFQTAVCTMRFDENEDPLEKLHGNIPLDSDRLSLN